MTLQTLSCKVALNGREGRELYAGEGYLTSVPPSDADQLEGTPEGQVVLRNLAEEGRSGSSTEFCRV